MAGWLAVETQLGEEQEELARAGYGATSSPS